MLATILFYIVIIGTIGAGIAFLDAILKNETVDAFTALCWFIIFAIILRGM